MGKKKMPMKTKELSLAMAESSSVIGEVQVEQQQVQLITPRKRGRPRKIVDKSEEEDDESLQEEMESKKAKSNEELVKKEDKEPSSPTTTVAANKDQPRRSRRKSKPRKSC